VLYDIIKNEEFKEFRSNEEINGVKETDNLILSEIVPPTPIHNSICQNSKALEFKVCNSFEELIHASLIKALKFNLSSFVDFLFKFCDTDLEVISYSALINGNDNLMSQDEIELFKFIKKFLYLTKTSRKKLIMTNLKSMFYRNSVLKISEFLEYLGFQGMIPDAKICHFAKLFYQQAKKLLEKFPIE
jgi:hypothetical protein